ncbi:hydroxylase/desaturase CTB9-like [Bradysia coprophila]|uniref:hydroxylase/desaturase CTB9-like n=1 Tax=Bradysia coprophila TaxID=38358 RepID=UPI00187DAD14|nr:hydroxylase/desaturase CTB9-like [Bradysia coprophila]
MSEQKPLDVAATLNYSRSVNNHSNERWYIDTITCPNGTKQSNFENHTVTVPVTDLRARENLANLDTTGFQTLVAPTSFNTECFLSDDNEEVIASYYEEVESLLRDLTGADEIVIFDHTFRKHNPACIETPLQREPVLRVHVDQTPVSSHDRIRYHVNDEFRNFKRFQIINVWRPIKDIVYDYPLAMADFRTVNVAEDLVATEVRYPPWLKDRETFAVKYNPMHKWYYWSHMQPDEVILFKCYDSFSSKLARARKNYMTVKENCLQDVAGFALHTAFLNESEADLNIKRQSIEVRAIVLHM